MCVEHLHNLCKAIYEAQELARKVCYKLFGLEMNSMFMLPAPGIITLNLQTERSCVVKATDNKINGKRKRESLYHLI